MNKDFWKNKNVFVTGVTGFVGSALARHLIEVGANVIGLVRDDLAKETFETRGLSQGLTLVHGSLEDYALLERTINEYEIDVVYHLAAQAIVGIANRSPLSTFHSNIEGSWKLLEACRNKDFIKAIVFASSDKSYGPHEKLPYKEDFPLQPKHPYDVSKACADLIAGSYVNTYDMPITITRFANIYGPGDYNFSRIVPDTIRTVLKGDAPIIRSDGTPERDYLYVDDVADIYLTLAENIDKTKGEVFNAGHNAPVSVLNLVKLILKQMNREDLQPDVQGKGSLHGEIDRQWLDGAKAKKVLGWEPKISLEEGIRKTIEWYEAEYRSNEKL